MAKRTATSEIKIQKEALNINFTCRFCEETKPYAEMVVVTDYFPPLTACRSCAKYLKNAEKKAEVPEVE